MDVGILRSNKTTKEAKEEVVCHFIALSIAFSSNCWKHSGAAVGGIIKVDALSPYVQPVVATDRNAKR